MSIGPSPPLLTNSGSPRALSIRQRCSPGCTKTARSTSKVSRQHLLPHSSPSAAHPLFESASQVSFLNLPFRKPDTLAPHVPAYKRQDHEKQIALAAWNPFSPGCRAVCRLQASGVVALDCKCPCFAPTAQVMAKERRSAMEAKAFRRSTMHDRLVGGAGGLICVQQGQEPSALESRRQAELVMATTRRTNFFKLPSLDLSKTARPLDGVRHSPAHAARRRAGSQTARDILAVAIARESIVNSLRARMVQTAARSEQGADGPVGADDSGSRAPVRLVSGAQTAR